MLDIFNTTIVGFLALAAGWAVMSPRVQTCLLVHVGLVFVSVGFLGLFLVSLAPYSYDSGIAAANAFVYLGLVLCSLGYLKRTRKSGHKRRSSDWIDL